MLILLGIVCLLAAAVVLFINQPSFGRLPRGERLARIERSPNYRDGQFRNRERTPQITSERSRVRTMLGFLFRSTENLRPAAPVTAVKTDLQTLDPGQDRLVWFGHSSYLILSGGRRILVDPVFRSAAPLGFLNKAFPGSDLYRPEDMPEVDVLVISHDHWDHLDYRTVRELRDRIGTVVCPLGVGAHFERWEFAPDRIVELDWDEETSPAEGFRIVCLPSRHFSGRGLTPNRSLWASYLLETPSQTIYIGGDGGYGSHFAQIGERFPEIDLAILENGQYNADWRYIHTLPDQLPQAAADLRARKVLTVHHSKYALARHPWDEPLKTAAAMAAHEPPTILQPVIGEVVEL